MSNKKKTKSFLDLGQKDNLMIVQCVCRTHNEFSIDEIEAALYIANPIIASSEGGLSVSLDHVFFMQLAKCVKAKTALEVSKSIDFLEGELIGEGSEIVFSAVCNNLVANAKNSFLDN